MKYRVYSKAEMIEKSRELIHAFMNRQNVPFSELLSEDFVWIGDYSFQYIQGKSAFLRTVEQEAQLPPLQLSQEEYAVLTHERYTWVTYGRCTATSVISEDQLLSSGIHFTFVWKQVKNKIYLMMAAASHVQDEQQQELGVTLSNTALPQARVFDQIQAGTLLQKNSPKIRIRDLSGNLHFLFPGEIVYAKSAGKSCTIHTVSGTEIIACMPLNRLEQTGFLRIHASYLVNRSFIVSIKRHQISLTDDTILPVGKQRYNAVVKTLEKV